ncbi:hypothetical protein [Sandaracinus amylolyticus]|uniref:aspartate-alanine antiporter-like transporter n=1 Tax=Sandaracinus amylolyticus TaxID=927083 RepID=UPI001F360EF1|nr:hypothetical protein [Sandaracinus amylolyticus]UJR82474.1 Hypothetical protein I5071_45390 [Sandaracinus amylolyticus]
MDTIEGLVQSMPEALLFLSIALGYLVGRIKLGRIELGSSTGCILVALVVGQLRPEISPVVQTIALALFMYSIGFKVGPQFFGHLDRHSLSQIALSVIVAVTGLGAVLAMAAILGLDKGTAAGLAAGALTQSSTIGAAVDTLGTLDLAPDRVSALRDNTAIAYAVTYVFGVFGVLTFVRTIAPRLMKIDLAGASAELDREMNGGRPPLKADQFYAYGERVARIHRATGTSAQQTVGDVLHALGGDQVHVVRVRRGGENHTVDASFVLAEGDELAITGPRETVLKAGDVVGPEVVEPAAAAAIGETLDIVVTRKQVQGQRLADLMRAHGPNVYPRSLTRMGHSLGVKDDLVLKRGDVLRVSGLAADVGALAKAIGTEARGSAMTDLVVMTLGIAIGIAIGHVEIPIGATKLTLGTGVGCLFMGLFFGWVRSVQPNLAQYPSAAQQVMADFGLAAFTAMVGLAAAPNALEALRENGLPVLFAGIVVTALPQLVGFVVGRYVMKIQPVVLLGALAGAESVTPAVNALTEEAKSTAPLLGFTLPYATSSVLITIWGIVVALAA